jgi:hypothetical protein
MKDRIKDDRSSISWGIVLLSFFLLSLPGCYEPIEGCLDAAAANFDIDADEPCADCCTFPVLKLDFQHKYVNGNRIDNLVFSDSVYYDINGHPFRLNSIRFYLSDLHLVRSNDTEVGVEDRLELGIWTSNLDTVHVNVEDNFTLADPDDFGSKELGTIRASGQFDRLRFTIGLDEVANRAVVNAFPDELLDHPLAQEDMYWDFDRGYIFNRIELTRDTAENTTPTLLEIGTAQNLITVDLPIDFNALEGFNIKVTLKIDYSLWFKSLDIKNDPASTLIEKIIANLADSFSLVAIDL